MPSERKLLLFLLIAATGFYVIFIFRTAFEIQGQRYFTLIDDAMISMRYARNLAQGHGLVWNIGQPPVEGFTNLGWTFILALVHFLPIPQSHISVVVMVIAATILLANIIVVHRAIRIILPFEVAISPMIAATIVAFYFPFVFWSLRGLEVGALILTMNLALIFAIRFARDDDPRALPGLILTLCLALLIRMDSVFQGGILLAYVLVKKPRSAVWPIVGSMLFMAAVFLFQKFYFGDFLPNTYYLKIAGIPIIERVRLGIMVLVQFASRDFLMPLFITLIGMAAYKELRTPEATVLLGLFLVQIGYSVWTGGDYAEDILNSANRFIAQGMTPLIMLLSVALGQILKNKTQIVPVLTVVIGLGAVIVMSGEPWALWIINNAPMLHTDIQRARIGMQVRENTDPAAVIAVHAAGQIPYFSERTSIDLLGKSDPVIAKGPPAASFTPGHNKWNYEYSIGSLKPDIVADRFNKLRYYMDENPDYRELPSGMYVRKDSRLVNFDGLAKEFH